MSDQKQQALRVGRALRALEADHVRDQANAVEQDTLTKQIAEIERQAADGQVETQWNKTVGLAYLRKEASCLVASFRRYAT